jgi:putative thioredoxin
LASLATPANEKASLDAFRRDVIDASKDCLVLVDFWAEWCGPCKTLGPLLEKVTAAKAPKVKLVKIDVDKNQSLASQFRIQSIPTVYAFMNGAPVDGFQGALGETELTAFIDKLLAGAPPSADEEAQEAEIKTLVEAANTASAAGDHEQALGIFGAILQQLPDRHDIAAHFSLALFAAGRTEDAERALAAIPDDVVDETVAKARAALALAADAPAAVDLAPIEAELAANPQDHARRYELAVAQLANGDRDAAAEALLHIIAAERGWNEDAARTKLLTLIEAAGLSDPWSIKVRARLRSILFS